MHTSECPCAAPDRRIDQAENPQLQPTGEGIDTDLEHCQEHAGHAMLALLEGDSTCSGAYRHRPEARQQC